MNAKLAILTVALGTLFFVVAKTLTPIEAIQDWLPSGYPPGASGYRPTAPESGSPEAEYYYGEEYKPTSRDEITQQWLDNFAENDKKSPDLPYMDRTPEVRKFLDDAAEEWHHPVTQEQINVIQNHERLKKELYTKYGIVLSNPVGGFTKPQTEKVNPVPVPNTIWLVLLGLIGMVRYNNFLR